MIEVKNLSHSFDTHEVLKGVNIQVNDGSILGLVGINGSGKSTFLRLISGVLTPTGGTVLFDGKDPQKGVNREDIFLLPDDPYYKGNTTCKSLLEFYRVFYPKVNESMYRHILGLSGLPYVKPLRNFSKGMRRQVYIALAFAIAPKYLLLDEAFDGLDPLARERFKNEVRRLAREQGCTFIVSSHALRELEGFCDSYAIISDNQILNNDYIQKDVCNLCKYQIVFETVPPLEAFNGLKLNKYKVTGHVVTVVIEGEDEEIRKKIEELHPILYDRLNVDFSEALIGNMDKIVAGGAK